MYRQINYINIEILKIVWRDQNPTGRIIFKAYDYNLDLTVNFKTNEKYFLGNIEVGRKFSHISNTQNKIEYTYNKKYKTYEIQNYLFFIPNLWDQYSGKKQILNYLYDNKSSFNKIRRTMYPNSLNVKVDDKVFESLNDNHLFSQIMQNQYLYKENPDFSKAVLEMLTRYNNLIKVMQHMLNMNIKFNDMMIALINTDSLIEKYENNPYSLYPVFTKEEADKIYLSLHNEDYAGFVRMSELSYLNILEYTNGDTIFFNNQLENIISNTLTTNLSSNISVNQIKEYLYDQKLIKKIDDDCIGITVYTKVDENFEKVISKIKKDNIYTVKNNVDAIPYILSHKLCCITGNAGTGKTTLISKITDELDKRGESFTLMSPTAAAAQVLANKTEQETSTIHSNLSPYVVQFRTPHIFGPNRFLNKYIIIDECSMIDSLLMDDILNSIDKTQHLILVGDNNQLSSVDKGQIFKDFINAGVPTVKLETVFRNEAGILYNANKILNGELPTETNDVKITETNDRSKIIETIMFHIKNLGVQRFLYDCLVITPSNVSNWGTIAMNKEIQSIIQKDNEVFYTDYNKNRYYTNDIIVVNKNLKEFDIVNGMRGVIESIDKRTSTFRIKFLERDETLKLPLYLLANQCSLNYVTTVHKAQGAGFKDVIIIADDSIPIMLNRNSLYTAITRGIESVQLIGNVNSYCTKSLSKIEQRLTKQSYKKLK